MPSSQDNPPPPGRRPPPPGGAAVPRPAGRIAGAPPRAAARAEKVAPAATARSSAPRARGPARSGTGEAPGNYEYSADDIIAYKYRLVRLLGRGGMGAIWVARNEKLDVEVAVKLIRRDVASAEKSQQLLREARAAARLEHPSIVRIFDFGETELDDPFIVMELLSGESLADLLVRSGRIAATTAVQMLLPIASALVEAHKTGIVHRDLKPENIMLTPGKSGAIVPKLLDFGIAKFQSVDDANHKPSLDGVVFGTPDYMSPQQAVGETGIDESADVWAFSVILYEAVTGKLPFEGPSYQARLFAILTEQPKSTTDHLAGDQALWDVLGSGLAKDKSARPTMRELGLRLARWLSSHGVDSDIAGTSLAAHWLDDSARPGSVRRAAASIAEIGRAPDAPEKTPAPAGILPPPGASPLATLPAPAKPPSDVGSRVTPIDPVSAPRSRRRAVVAGAALASVLLALVAVRLSRHSARGGEPSAAPSSREAPPVQVVAPAAVLARDPPTVEPAAASAEPSAATAAVLAPSTPVRRKSSPPAARTTTAIQPGAALPIAKKPNF